MQTTEEAEPAGPPSVVPPERTLNSWQAEGPFCTLPSAPPWNRQAEGVLQLVTPAATAALRDRILREIDALLWERTARALDLTAKSGKLHPATGSMLAEVIRDGLKGTLPLSWVPTELQGSVPVRGFAGFPRPARAVAYALAAHPEASAGRPKATPFRLATRRLLIPDKHPGLTVRSTWKIDYKTWSRWCNDDENVRLANLLLDLITLELLPQLGTPSGEALMREWLLNDVGE